MAPQKGEVKCILIPAEVGEEIQELTVGYSEETEVSCVQDLAKAHFRRVKPQKTAAQAAAQRQALLQQIPEQQRKGLSDALLSQATDMGMVEHVALLSNATDNNFTGVTMYCDDEAVALGLPLNRRASEIASCAGKPSEVRGDVFMARVFDNEAEFQRLDFTLAEVSSSAAWVREAAAQNERKRKAEASHVTLERLQRQAGAKAAAPAQVRELSPGEAEKERGNALFKQGQYAEALQAYSRAAQAEPGLLVAWNNRAMARLRLGDAAGAEADASHVLAAEPCNVKALLRRAAAREQLGRAPKALADYAEAVRLEPSNKAAAERAKALQSSAPA